MAVSIVQFAKGLAGSGVTFGAAPTNGNYLVALVGMDVGNTAASGWTRTERLTEGGTNIRVAAYWKLCGAGESTSQNPSTSDYLVGIWEIAGFSGTWATDLTWGGDPNGQTFANATGPSGVDCLALICVSERDNSSGIGSTPTFLTPTVTTDGQGASTADGRFGACWGHNITTAGTAVNPTATYSTGGAPGSGWEAYTAVLIPKGASDVQEALAQATITLTSYGVGDASVFEALAQATTALTAYGLGEQVNVFEALTQATAALTSYTLIEGFLALEPLAQAAILLTAYALLSKVNDLALGYTHNPPPQPAITEPALAQKRTTPGTLYYEQ
jgi:hypothetical protein